MEVVVAGIREHPQTDKLYKTGGHYSMSHPGLICTAQLLD